MNINNVDNALAGGLAKGKRVSGQKETDRTERTGRREKVQQPEVENRANEGAASRPVTDVYEVTDTKKLAAELVKNLGTVEPEPREDLVNRAKERARNGFYNTGDFMSRLAMKLINTGAALL